MGAILRSLRVAGGAARFAPMRGVLGAVIPSAGQHGPSPVYDSLDLPGDATNVYAFTLTSAPLGTVLNPDLSVEMPVNADGSYSITGRLYENGTDLGLVTASVGVGDVTTPVSSDLALTWAVAQRVSSDLGLSWSVAQQVSSDLALSWAVQSNVQTTQVSADLALSWSVDGVTAEPGADMITATQAREYLDMALGISVPAFMLAAAVAKVAWAVPAMVAAGYSVADMTMIQCQAVALVAAAGSPRRIGSQGAASGASRSFKYSDADLSALRRSLRALDTAGTVAGIVGPDPAGAALLWVV